MNKILFYIITLSISVCLLLGSQLHAKNVAQPVPINSISKVQGITLTMTRVADWMWNNRYLVPGGKMPDWSWTNAVWFTGILELYTLTKNEKYFTQVLDIGEQLKWDMGPRLRFADDQCIAQVYADLYLLTNNPEMIAKIRMVYDSMITDQVDLPLNKHHEVCLKGEWSWSDSLFMAPPVLVKLYKATGEKKYLDFMNTKWWKTYDFLYDPEEHLYFRDSNHFDLREKNGEKNFWSRGNGWVMSGLVRILEHLPASYPSRNRYIELYEEMAEKIASLQQSDGFWRASLLSPESFPEGETSGTALFCYAFAWGINRGYLPKDQYFPVVMHAWQALESAVQDSGKIGYIQPIGGEPNQTRQNDTDVFGVGAFLLAGSEVIKLLKLFPTAHLTN